MFPLSFIKLRIKYLLAMRAADLGVLSIPQTGECPPLLCEEADVVIRDIKEIIL